MSAHKINGELIPLGGGDSIPLARSPLVLGRRESCDICLQFPSISGAHCELTYKEGLWILRDLDSKNGTLVNDIRMDMGARKIVHHGDILSIGKRSFKIEYVETGRAADLEDFSEEMENIVKVPLLDKANLVHPPRHRRKPDDQDRTPVVDEP
jgi:pSer/pThr/pTyr-binding forkhead associated (FHA) protein